MAVQFNGASCCSPTQKQQKQAPAARFGNAQARNLSQRPGGAGQVQFGFVDGGVVSGPCSCIGCCCAPFLAIPLAIAAFFVGKKAFRGIGGLGSAVSRGVRGLGERASNVAKRGGKQAAEAAKAAE